MTFRTGERRTGTRHDTNNRKARNIMETNTRNHRKVALTVLALGAATAAVVFGSLAAWTAQTTNPGNTVTAGTMGLDNDNDGNAVVVTSDAVYPGDSNEPGQDVTLENVGDADLDVTLTIADATTDVLSTELEVQISDGTRCIYPEDLVADCGTNWGAWSALDGAYSLGTWAPLDSSTYNVKWRLPDIVAGNDNAGQGQTASFNMTWDGVLTS
jgi:predicted ribosomally synthesized peptide with SipW-like signal peptide